MKVVIPRQPDPDEPRIAATPESVTAMKNLELEIVVEAGLGKHLGWSDADYEKAGATIASGDAVHEGADLIACVQPPSPEQIAKFPKGVMYAGFLDPFNRDDLVGRSPSSRPPSKQTGAVSFTERAVRIGPLVTPPRGVGALGFGRRAETPDHNDPNPGQTRPDSLTLGLSVYRFVRSEPRAERASYFVAPR